jgi:hypothetical protein
MIDKEGRKQHFDLASATEAEARGRTSKIVGRPNCGRGGAPHNQKNILWGA